MFPTSFPVALLVAAARVNVPTVFVSGGPMLAGGVYAVMNELDKKGLLYIDLIIATGKTVGENIAECANKDSETIRQIENPYSETGGIVALKGNLAPKGLIVKRSAVYDEMLAHVGPARVFDCEEEAIRAIKNTVYNYLEYRDVSMNSPCKIEKHDYEVDFISHVNTNTKDYITMMSN